MLCRDFTQEEDDSQEEGEEMKIRYAEWKSNTTAPPREIKQQLYEGERIINVETVKDSHGFAWARVWIIMEESK